MLSLPATLLGALLLGAGPRGVLLAACKYYLTLKFIMSMAGSWQISPSCAVDVLIWAFLLPTAFALVAHPQSSSTGARPLILLAFSSPISGPLPPPSTAPRLQDPPSSITPRSCMRADVPYGGNAALIRGAGCHCCPGHLPTSQDSCPVGVPLSKGTSRNRDGSEGFG